MFKKRIKKQVSQCKEKNKVCQMLSIIIASTGQCKISTNGTKNQNNVNNTQQPQPNIPNINATQNPQGTTPQVNNSAQN